LSPSDVACILCPREWTLSGLIFRIAVGFVVGVLIVLAGSLYLSNRYLTEQRQLAASGDTKGAIEKARLAARFNPVDSAPLAAEASVLLQQARPEEAVEVLREATRRDPANQSNLAQLGNVQINQLNDPEAAAESYRKALERDPRDKGLVASYAGSLIRIGDLEGAKREYEKLAGWGEIQLGNLYTLGRIYARTGEPEKALRTLRGAQEAATEALERVPDSQKDKLETFMDSVDLAIVDALVIEERYDEARLILEDSDAEQAPAIIELLYTNPEEYRESVLNREL
jgi:tetratricopeptide (TPR) repeat protein